MAQLMFKQYQEDSSEIESGSDDQQNCFKGAYDYAQGIVIKRLINNRVELLENF